MTQAPTPGPLTVEITYEVYQDGDFCASSTHLQDAEHYANLYGQDGPVKCQTVVSVRHDDFLLSGDARLAPTAPVEASGSELKADFVRSHPSGMDDSTYEKIEDALDRADAPITGPDGKFLTLAQRVAAFRPQPSGETREAVARLVDPDAWIMTDHWRSLANRPDLDQRIHERQQPSLVKADAILALLSARPLAVGGQQGERQVLAGSMLHILSVDETPARAEALSLTRDSIARLIDPAAIEIVERGDYNPSATARHEKALVTADAILALGRTEAQDEGASEDTGRQAIWKLVHAVWCLLDDAETDSAGITTPDQQRWTEVSQAMDELKALVPSSEGPTWGGYPVNYLWPKGGSK